MTWYTVRRDTIDWFKGAWPCHGLPDNLECRHGSTTR